MLKKAPEFYMTLRQAADYLGYTNTYGTRVIKNLIAAREIEATVVTRGKSSTRNDWKVSFNSIEKWRLNNLT